MTERICVLMVLGLIAVLQPKTKPSLSITLSTKIPTVMAGAAIDVKIATHNNTSHELNCTRTRSGSINDRYTFEIQDANGKILKARQMHEASIFQCSLPAHDSDDWETLITPYDYPGLIAGTYKVRISTEDPDNPQGARLYSNSIVVTIQPSAK
jgi:hypothetical protein